MEKTNETKREQKLVAEMDPKIRTFISVLSKELPTSEKKLIRIWLDQQYDPCPQCQARHNPKVACCCRSQDCYCRWT